MLRSVLAVILVAVLGASVALARPAVDARHGRPPPLLSDKIRCSDDGRDCIRAVHYVADVCKLIERNAARNGLDPNFLARLLWKESRFEPSAVSPAGAQGIAQFIPSTAKLYDLDDPFNPAQAIARSAWYLSGLRDYFGNIGIAAVAYNGGETRASRFMGGGTVLPYETQDYVQAITGFNAWRWRDDPPGDDELKLTLDPDLPFRAACEKLAGNRSLREFTTPPRPAPWGVIVASHPQRGAALKRVAQLNRKLAPLLGQKKVTYLRRPLRPGTKPVYTAQVGFNSESSARKLCVRMRALSIGCIVLKN